MKKKPKPKLPREDKFAPVGLDFKIKDSQGNIIREPKKPAA